MTIPSTNKNNNHLFVCKRAHLLLWGITFCVIFSGCKLGLDMSEFTDFVSRESFENPDGANLSDAPQPTLMSKMRLPEFLGGTKDETPRYRRAASAQATARYKRAEALFEKKEYKKAEKEFAKIAKRYNDTTIEEDALFMVAESQFMRKRYSWAQDSYDELLDEFPSSRHLSKSTAKLFIIAHTWLNSPDVVTSDDLRQVNLENPKKTPLVKTPKKKFYDPTRLVPILPNVHDRSRPIFDTDGRALQALKSIWLNDPTGKLADDALMLAASHHLRKEEYLEADRLLKIIRDEYPKSSHLQSAFEIGSFVKQASYQGDLYDVNPLLEAEKLKKSSQRIFLTSGNNERQQKELAKIAEAKAAHEWQNVIYWEKKGYPQSVAVYCQVVMDEHPDSKYAEMARKKLAKIRKQPPRKEWSIPKLKPVTIPNLRSIKFPKLIPIPKDKDKVDEESARTKVASEE